MTQKSMTKHQQQNNYKKGKRHLINSEKVLGIYGTKRGLTSLIYKEFLKTEEQRIIKKKKNEENMKIQYNERYKCDQ